MKFFIYIITASAFIALGVTLAGCDSLPLMFQSLDNIITDEAVVVEIERSAMLEDTDIEINVKVINKDAPTPIVVQNPPK